MADSRWWTRARGLPPARHASWAQSLGERPDRQVRVLAWAVTPDGFAIGSPSALSYGDEDAWTHLGWHQIERGGWDGESGRLSWSLSGDGSDSDGAVELTEPGRLPEVFRERVAASIVLEKFVPILNGRGVVINGRRDLAEGDRPIAWAAVLGRGLTWQMDGVPAAVDEALAQVKIEYDRG